MSYLQSSDSFTFDVSNGISRLSSLSFHLTILPRTLYIETRPLLVTEGNSAPLLPANLHVVTKYYADKIQDYLVVDPPLSGWLEATGTKNEKQVRIFSVKDLEQESILVSKERLLEPFMYLS